MSKPRIILIDIETSPIFGYTWDTYQTNVLKIIESSKIISVAWKLLGQKTTYCKSLLDYEGYKGGTINDESLIKDTWKVLDEADIVIAHHGDAFDIKKLNARFVFYGLNAPSFYKTIDTRKIAKKYFKFDSNKLANLGDYLGVGQKEETGGFKLWIDCIAGDPAAWKKMKSYNSMDVVLLESIYYKLRPFIENHPNLSLLSGDTGLVCQSCLSTNVQKRGFAYTQMGKKQRFQCNDCFSWSSGAWSKG